jgi:hypothetical protein
LRHCADEQRAQIRRFDDLRDELKLEEDEYAAVIDGEDFGLMRTADRPYAQARLLGLGGVRPSLAEPAR